jgi:sn-glycerol 3-phosphate transport system ATP-binding protein/multiple sugar transport system ATP-binding protein
MAISVEEPHEPALPVRLVLSEMTGSDIILHCDSPAGRITLTSPRKDVPRHADNFWVMCDLDRVVFFDNQSGSRVNISAVDRGI